MKTLPPSARSAEQNNRSHLTGMSIVVYDDPFRARRPLIDCFGGEVSGRHVCMQKKLLRGLFEVFTYSKKLHPTPHMCTRIKGHNTNPLELR